MSNPKSTHQDPVGSGVRLLKSIAVCSLLLALVAWLVPAASAQTAARFRPQTWRLTVPAFTFTTNSFITTSNYFTFGTGTVSDVTLTVPDLPADTGVRFRVIDHSGLVTNLFTNSAVFTSPYSCTNGVFVTIDYTNLTEMVKRITLTATGGATGNIPLILQSAYIWNGLTNSRLTGVGPWNAATNWSPASVPGVADDVVFTDTGGQTNVVYFQTNAPATNTSASFTTNVLINADASVASVRFANRSGATIFHSLQIDAGRTLNVLGTNGFTLYPDRLSSSVTAATIDGPSVILQGAGKLIVSNSSAIFGILAGRPNVNASVLLNMSNLNTLIVDVGQVRFADYRIFPFTDSYTEQNNINLGANGLSGQTLSLMWAKTNSIRSTFVDPYNYTNADHRDYSLTLISDLGNGSNPNSPILLGITNGFAMDSICFGGNGSVLTANFNPVFGSNNPTAVFRAANGTGRMSMFAVGDTAGNSNSISSNVKTTVDFSTARGSVDLLTDRLYIGRDRALISSNESANVSAELALGSGIADVNYVVVGAQMESNQVDYPGTKPQWGYVNATLRLNSNIVFKVNKTLTLGYTANTLSIISGQQYNTRGRFFLSGNATGLVNTILVDPGLGLSTGNQITLSSGSRLYVSNTIASSAKALDTLSVGSSSVLGLHVDGSLGTPLVYTTNLSTSPGATIRLLNIINVSSFPATIPLISYQLGSPSFGGIAPTGTNVTILDDGSTISAFISTNPPRTLFWRGGTPGSSAVWDTVAAHTNWFYPVTGTHTNFQGGDYAVFENNILYPSAVSVAGVNMLVGGIDITNSAAMNYSFTQLGGSGNIAGSGYITNQGAGSTLSLNFPCDLNLTMLSGDLQGSSSGDDAAIGSVNLPAGSVMRYNGVINGGLSCGGIATISNQLNGALLVSGTGILTNYSAAFGPITVQSGTLLVNESGALLSGFGSWSTPTNSTLINRGDIGSLSDTLLGISDILTVGGTFKDNGAGNLRLTTLVIGAGTTNGAGLFYPGNSDSGIGRTTVISSQFSSTAGRITMQARSTNVFRVDMADSNTNTVLSAVLTDFGGSQSRFSIDGCAIVINNVGAPFAAGQVFKLFDRNGGGILGESGSATNILPQIYPPTPGPGLGWDLSSLRDANADPSLVNNGYIKVRAMPTVGTNLTYSYTNSFRLISNAANTVVTGTNGLVVSRLSWPTNYIGWTLESQEISRSVGLKPHYTNWSVNYRSVFTNIIYMTNDVDTNGILFRLVFPIPDIDHQQ